MTGSVRVARVLACAVVLALGCGRVATEPGGDDASVGDADAARPPSPDAAPDVTVDTSVTDGDAVTDESVGDAAGPEVDGADAADAAEAADAVDAADATDATEATDAVDATDATDAIVVDGAENDTSDTGAPPRLLAQLTKGLRGVAVDPDAAWVTCFDGYVHRVPLDGGPATPFADAGWPTYVGVDATHVYWTNLGMGALGNVARKAKAGGAIEILSANQSSANSLALYGTGVLFAAHESSDAGSGYIGSVPRVGGPTTPLASSLAAPYYVASNGTDVCWIDFTPSASVMCLRDGTPQPLVTGEARIWALAIDATHAFWISDAPKLRTAPLAGGPASDLAPADVVQFGAEIALDATHVYYVVATANGSVRKVAKSGGAVAVLATDTHPIGIALDATHVYWTTFGGALKRLRR